MPVAFWVLMRCLVGPLRTAIKLLSYLFMGDRTPSICMYKGSVVHLSNCVATTEYFSMRLLILHHSLQSLYVYHAPGMQLR